MFKRLVYNEIIRVLNLNTQTITSNGKTQKLYFEGGYLLGIYPSGIPYAVKQLDPTTKFSYDTVEIIPVSEELSMETPSVNKTDRSDYALKYSIMFRSTIQTEIEAALEEFRDYFYTNKQFSLDGYVVSIKTTRGDKLPQVGMDGGHYFNYYTFSVYLTAIKNGYIKKDTDTWGIGFDTNFGDTVIASSMVVGKPYEIKTVGTTDFTLYGAESNTIGTRFIATAIGTGTGTVTNSYQMMSTVTDIFSTQGNPIFTNKEETGKGFLTTYTSNAKLQVFYDSTYLDKHLYSVGMNKEDKDTVYRFEHIFDGETFTYLGYISNVTRTLTPNGVVILELDWIEQD